MISIKKISSHSFITLLGIVGIAAASTGFEASAQSTSLVCQKQIGGSWNFGVAPAGCDVSVAADITTVAKEFKPVVYLEKNPSSTARTAYMTSMYAALGEISSYYIHRRNPQVSSAEAQAFQQAIYALAQQESYWTHYRFGTDSVLRYMRGDSLHGYGLMQVDDRSHTAALKQGKGVDLVYNVIYGLDIYYASWVRSATASCISSASNFRDRTRSSWAAYNGGPGAICRWTRGGASDVAFASKIDKKAWMAYVRSTTTASGLNVVCLAEGTRPCYSALNLSASPVVNVETEAIPPVAATATYKLIASKTYAVLRTCASVSCDHTGVIVHSSSQVQMTGKQNGKWVEVSVAGASGWIRSSNLEVIQ